MLTDAIYAEIERRADLRIADVVEHALTLRRCRMAANCWRHGTDGRIQAYTQARIRYHHARRGHLSHDTVSTLDRFLRVEKELQRWEQEYHANPCSCLEKKR